MVIFGAQLHKIACSCLFK